MDSSEPQQIALSTAFVAVMVSSLLRAPWFVLVLIMPATAAGVTLLCLVLLSAGVLLLHWCLTWFGWTIPFRAALAARALPAIVAVSTTGAFGLRASLPVLLAMAGLELLLATAVVATTAKRLHPVDGITGFDEGELLPLLLDDDPLPVEDRYGRDVASLVREARDARLRPSGRASY
jgi:hypothetical protein